MSAEKISPTKTIAVVGAGLSGTLVAANLLRLASTPVRVVLIDRRLLPGQGVAYGTLCPDHLLNVPADRMGVWADEPDHFLRWLREHKGEAGVPDHVEPGDFLPRCLYGAYVGRVFAEVRASAPGDAECEEIEGEVVDIEERAGGGHC